MMSNQNEQETINRILLAVNESRTVEQLCKLAGEQLSFLIPFERASIALCDEDEGRLRIFGLFGSGVGSLVIGAVGELKGSVSEYAFSKRETVILQAIEIKNRSFIHYEDHSREGFQSALCVPLFWGDKSLGTLNLTSRISSAYTSRHVELLEELRLPLSIAIEKIHLLDQTEQRNRELENLHFENDKLITELKEVSKIKDAFLTTVIHELRTPLMAIKGWVELLAANPAVQQNADAKEGLEVIQNSTNALSLQISDLMDMSRLQMQTLKLNLQALDINKSITESARAVRHLVNDKELELVLDLKEDLPEIHADKQRVQQILWNLLTNAIKFTSEGGKIMIRSMFAEESESASRVVIEVEDTGEGIPQDFLPHIWKRFRQAETKEQKSGLGIGLSLVKELTEAHGGNVSVKTSDKGTTFTVYLPFNS